MQHVWKASLVAVAVVVVTGLIDLAQPLTGDQSLFLTGAREMARGAVLYRDFWDLKQPGIYDFYYVAGTLGGFSAVTLHVFEIVYSSVFAVVLTVALSRSRTFAAGAPFAAFFAIAWYYLVTSAPQQLQVEALSGFPLFLTAWFAWEGSRRTGRGKYTAFAAAGVAAGIALLFKMMFAPLAVLMVATILAWPDVKRFAPGTIAFVAVAFVAGAAVPIGATLAVLAHGGALDAALDTWFIVPPQIFAAPPVEHRGVLFKGIAWFTHSYAAPIVLALAGAFTLVRSRRGDALARALGVWIVTGILTIVVQRTSWWAYHWILLSVPIGCFAAAALGTRARWPLAITAMIALATARPEIRNLVMLAQSHFAMNLSDREFYRGRVWSPYVAALSDATLLPRDAQVYVMGNPIYYVVTGRLQPLAINGWSLELLLPRQRTELLREFRAQPPPYVFITKDDLGPASLMSHCPAFATYFASHYALGAQGRLGNLYRYRGS